jgi:hypothetical protein
LHDRRSERFSALAVLYIGVDATLRRTAAERGDRDAFFR